MQTSFSSSPLVPWGREWGLIGHIVLKEEITFQLSAEVLKKDQFLKFHLFYDFFCHIDFHIWGKGEKIRSYFGEFRYFGQVKLLLVFIVPVAAITTKGEKQNLRSYTIAF